MYLESGVAPVETGPFVGAEELAEGLMLVRASTLKVVRLQLAMERHDRQVALEVVDDLVALDRRLQDYLDKVPALGDHTSCRGQLESERAMLNREKLTLAAGINTHARARLPALPVNSDSGELGGSMDALIQKETCWALVEDSTNDTTEPEPMVDGSEVALGVLAADETAGQSRWWPFGLLLLILAVASAVYFLGIFDLIPDWAQKLGRADDSF